MRLSTVFISSAFVLAGMSAALPIDKENMLMARFADSDSIAEVEARTYNEELGLYARGPVVSKVQTQKEHNRANRPAIHRTGSSRASSASSERPPTPPPSRIDTDSHRSPSPFTAAQQRNRMETDLSGTTPKHDFSGTTLSHVRTSPSRRSFYETSRNDLNRRGLRTWVKNGYSKVTGFFGGSAPAQPMGEPQ